MTPERLIVPLSSVVTVLILLLLSQCGYCVYHVRTPCFINMRIHRPAACASGERKCPLPPHRRRETRRWPRRRVASGAHPRRAVEDARLVVLAHEPRTPTLAPRCPGIVVVRCHRNSVQAAQRRPAGADASARGCAQSKTAMQRQRHLRQRH